MNSALIRLNKRGILATDIAEQFWCERQMEYGYLYGKERTQYMKTGSNIHKKLEEKVRVEVDATPLNYADFLCKESYENYMSLLSLTEKGVGREIKIYGSVNGYRLSGKIDELKMLDGKTTVVEVKTKARNGSLRSGSSSSGVSNSSMRRHKVQLMLYKKMLDDVKSGAYSFDNFKKIYGIEKMTLTDQFTKQLQMLNIEEKFINLDSSYELMFNELKLLPEISNEMELRYIDQHSGEVFSSTTLTYDKEEMDKDLGFVLEYWNGGREALPVPESEKWKCNFCRFFGKECKVWYNV